MGGVDQEWKERKRRESREGTDAGVGSNTYRRTAGQRPVLRSEEKCTRRKKAFGVDIFFWMLSFIRLVATCLGSGYSSSVLFLTICSTHSAARRKPGSICMALIFNHHS